MVDRHLVVRLAVALVLVGGFSQATRADDCLRRIGLGYSAGYHAPAACPAPSCHEKLSVWHGWKQACTFPNARPIGGDCGCAPCVPAAPCCGVPFGCGFGMRLLPAATGCSTCSGGYGQPSRAALMFN